MPKLSAVVPDELGATLEARARAEDRSVSAVIRRALVEHLISPSLTGSRVPTEARTLSSQTGAGGTHSEAEERAVEARSRRDNEGKT